MPGLDFDQARVGNGVVDLASHHGRSRNVVRADALYGPSPTLGDLPARPSRNMDNLARSEAGEELGAAARAFRLATDPARRRFAFGSEAL